MWDLKRLFQKHAQEIDRFLRKRGHQPDVASDLTQDVFLRVGLEKRSTISIPCEPSGDEANVGDHDPRLG